MTFTSQCSNIIESTENKEVLFESPNPNGQDPAQINQVFVLPELNPEAEAPVRNTLFNLGRTRSELREVVDG